MLVFVFGLFNVFRHAGPLGEMVPILAIWTFLVVTLVNGWRPAGGIPDARCADSSPRWWCSSCSS